MRLCLPQVFNLLTVNAWPRFLHSKQAQRANELLGWASNFDSFSDREQAGLINKLRKMRDLSSQKRASVTGGGDGLVEHTHISAGGVSSYHQDKEDSGLEVPRDAHPVHSLLMSPASRPYGEHTASGGSHPPGTGSSRRRSSIGLPLGHRGSYVPLGLLAADEAGDATGSAASSGCALPTDHSPSAKPTVIASITEESKEQSGGTISVALMQCAPSPAANGSVGGPSQKSSNGLLSTAPTIALNALNSDSVEDAELDSDRAAENK